LNETQYRPGTLTTEQPKISLKGILIPSNWDEMGNITSLKIASANEKEYIILNQDVSDMIATYLRKEITVTGVLEQWGTVTYIHVQDVIKQAH
jgi:hypothetical protein